MDNTSPGEEQKTRGSRRKKMKTSQNYSFFLFFSCFSLSFFLVVIFIQFISFCSPAFPCFALPPSLPSIFKFSSSSLPNLWLHHLHAWWISVGVGSEGTQQTSILTPSCLVFPPSPPPPPIHFQRPSCPPILCHGLFLPCFPAVSHLIEVMLFSPLIGWN